MPDLETTPIALALAFLFAIAMLRGQATYWIARSVTEQALKRTHPATGWRARFHGWLASDALDHGRGALQRCGIIAVPLCYLTVGFQTAVLAAAGVLRMRWLRFTVAQSFGAAAWAVIYATVGFAVWAALFERALAGGPGFVVGVAVALAIVGAVVHRVLTVRRRRTAAAAAPVEETTSAEL